MKIMVSRYPSNMLGTNILQLLEIRHAIVLNIANTPINKIIRKMTDNTIGLTRENFVVTEGDLQREAEKYDNAL